MRYHFVTFFLRNLFVSLSFLFVACSLYSQQSDGLIGLPFSLITPDSTVKKFVISEITNFNGFDFKIDSFKKEKKHKALAVNYELITGMSNEPYYYLNTWGAAWGYSSVEEAQKAATVECTKASTYRPGTILFLMIDDSLNIPNELFEQYKKKEFDIANEERRKFLFANKTVPLNDASDQSIFLVDVQNGLLGNHGDSIRLSPHFPLTIRYPDRKIDYAAACQGRVFYALQIVNTQDTGFYYKELNQLLRRGLYGTYNRSVSTVMNYRIEVANRLMEKIAKFSSHLYVKRDSIDLNLPYNLRIALKDETIQEIWTEGAVRITDDGIPLEKDTVVKPLAILTEKGLYIAVEIRMPDTREYCSISEDFHDKIIDITIYKDDEESRRKVYATLMDNLEKVFSRQPFSAEKVKKQYPPGEMWMIRNALPSLILGEPFYESSTYTFKVYYAGEGKGDLESMYNKESFKGVSKKNIFSSRVFLYLEVNNVSSSKAHRNDPFYVDLTSDDQAKYTKHINSAITEAVRKTCSDLNGKMDVTICDLK